MHYDGAQGAACDAGVAGRVDQEAGRQLSEGSGHLGARQRRGMVAGLAVRPEVSQGQAAQARSNYTSKRKAPQTHGLCKVMWAPFLLL